MAIVDNGYCRKGIVAPCWVPRRGGDCGIGFAAGVGVLKMKMVGRRQRWRWRWRWPKPSSSSPTSNFNPSHPFPNYNLIVSICHSIPLSVVEPSTQYFDILYHFYTQIQWYPPTILISARQFLNYLNYSAWWRYIQRETTRVPFVVEVGERNQREGAKVRKMPGKICLQSLIWVTSLQIVAVFQICPQHNDKVPKWLLGCPAILS